MFLELVSSLVIILTPKVKERAVCFKLHVCVPLLTSYVEIITLNVLILGHGIFAR
jgi:hypothetical protein